MCLCFIILNLNAALFSCLLSSLFPISLVLQSLVPSLYSLPGFQSLEDGSIILSIFSLQYFVWFRLLILFYALFRFIYNSTCFSFINYFCFMSLDNDKTSFIFFFFYFFLIIAAALLTRTGTLNDTFYMRIQWILPGNSHFAQLFSRNLTIESIVKNLYLNMSTEIDRRSVWEQPT